MHTKGKTLNPSLTYRVLKAYAPIQVACYHFEFHPFISNILYFHLFGPYIIIRYQGTGSLLESYIVNHQRRRKANYQSYKKKSVSVEEQVQGTDLLLRFSVLNTSFQRLVSIYLPPRFLLDRFLIKELQGERFLQDCPMEYGVIQCKTVFFSQLQKCQECLRRLDNGDTLNLCVYPAYSTKNCFFVSYVAQLKCFCLYCLGDTLLFFDPTDISANPILPEFPTLVQSLVQIFKGPNQLKIQQQLHTRTLVGWVENTRIVFTHIFEENLDIELLCPMEQTSSLFVQLQLPHPPSLFQQGWICVSAQQLMARLAELQFKISNNKQNLDHKVLRIFNATQIIAQFEVRNFQSTIYSAIAECVSRQLEYTSISRNRFPAMYYLSLFRELQSLQSESKDAQVLLRLVQYAKAMKFDPQSVAQSPYVEQICQIDRSNYEDCESNTFLVYLLVLPPGMPKLAVFEAIASKSDFFNCKVCTVKKNSDNKQGLDTQALVSHLQGPQTFSRSRFSPILVNVPFYQHLPQQLEEALSKYCPEECHYKIFHVLPDCQGMSFKNEVVDSVVSYPFSAELIIYGLLSIQAQRHHPNAEIKGAGIDSLSKALHLISSNFKNFKADRYEHTRHRIISLDAQVTFENGLPAHLLNTLQELLQMSYKKQYNRNDNLLYYFLEEIQNLVIADSPNPDSWAEQILQQSFENLPFYPIHKQHN